MLILQQIPRFYLEFIAIISLTALIYFLLIFNYTFSSLIVIVGLFAAAAFKILPSVNRILNSYVNMRYGLASVGVISKDINMPSPKIEAKLVKGKKLKLNSKIELKNISYNYPSTNKKILENLNLEIKANSTIGIIGESGAGKSTLIDLIIGILNPSEGKVLIDGNNISEQKRLWQNNIGYIPQNIVILNQSLKDNILFGSDPKNFSDKKITNILKEVNLENFLKKLPNGLRQIIKEDGQNISGGEKQRIGIARALLNNPKIIILDEATSGLDSFTEMKVLETINKIKKTIIIVSHRINTLKFCDKVYNIEKNTLKLINKSNLFKNEFSKK